MAEHVQASLDDMVAPLRDLMDRHIFNAEEIQAIVARRRESEYLLRRRVARKADFLRFIEAEQLLEELRSLRCLKQSRDHRNSRRQAAKENKKKDNDDEEDDDDRKGKKKHHIGDLHIVQWIHLLFVRAIRKFRSDLSLHLLHADFCKQQKAWTRLGKVYGEALQVFPHEAGLWIEAASLEFFGPRKSIRNARVLLQRGIRLNPKAADLWMEYLSLELHYAQTLQGRKNILLGSPNSNTNDGRNNRMTSDDNGGDGEEDDDDNDENKYDEIIKDKDPENGEEQDNGYKIAWIVLKNALQASIPDALSFRLKVLETCRRFPNTQRLMEQVVDSLQTDFPHQPQAWMARALYEAEKYALRNGVDSFPHPHKNNHTPPQTLTRMEESAKEAAQQDLPNEAIDNPLEEKEKKKNQNGELNPHDNSLEERSSKKSKIQNPVVAVLNEALDSCRKANKQQQYEEMQLMVFRFAQQYYDEQERRQDVDAMRQTKQFLESILSSEAGLCRLADLALEKAEYYIFEQERDKAIQVLKRFCMQNTPSSSEKEADRHISATPWIRWASLVMDNNTNDKGEESSGLQAATSTLQKAMQRIPMTQSKDYLQVVLQYFGCLLLSLSSLSSEQQENEGSNSRQEQKLKAMLQDTFQTILLLSPTSSDFIIEDVQDYPFGIVSVPHAYCKYLQMTLDKFGLVVARKVYETVLDHPSLVLSSTSTTTTTSSSSSSSTRTTTTVDYCQQFFETCINMEQRIGKKDRLRLKRIFNRAMEVFEDTSLEETFRQRRKDIMFLV